MGNRSGGEGRNKDSTGHDPRKVTGTEDGELHVLAQDQENSGNHRRAMASSIAFSPAVKPDDVDQLPKDLSTKLKVDECAEDMMQGEEPEENYNSKGQVDGKSNADDGEHCGHGHPEKASTSATVSAAIPADHAEGTNRSTEDVNMSVNVESSAHVNDTSLEEGTSSTMVRGSDIDEPGGTPASWPEEREMLQRYIKSLEINIYEWREQFQRACHDRDWHRNDAAGKEMRFQEACQERQWHINEGAEKEKEIIRLQEAHSAEYLSRLRHIRQMLSNSSVSNPARHRRSSSMAIYHPFSSRAGKPEGKPCDASAIQELDSLIDVITRRNVSAPKSSAPGQHWIVPQDIEELMAEIKSLQHTVANLEADNSKLRKNLSSMEIEHGKLSHSGSYRENSATPTHVSDGFTNLSVTVDSFKSRLLNYLLQNHSADLVNKELSKTYGNVNPLRPNHLPALLLKAKTTSILFQNFENESFDKAGYCVCPDPTKRKDMFFSWFLHFRNHKGDQGDQFVRYYERIKARAWKIFGVKSEHEGLEVALRKAAQNAWSLHLLSFSFEPPASLFRVCCGATFDKNYMEAPASLEVDQDSVATVAFMMTPGLRVDKFFFIKSEIYPKVEDLKSGQGTPGST